MKAWDQMRPDSYSSVGAHRAIAQPGISTVSLDVERDRATARMQHIDDGDDTIMRQIRTEMVHRRKRGLDCR